MKFWQFISVCEELDIQIDLINLDNKWNKFILWYKSFDDIVDKQDRSKLDSITPDDLCKEVFSLANTTYYVSGGYLRKLPMQSSDKTISVLEIFKKYGGTALEQIIEAGLVEVDSEEK